MRKILIIDDDKDILSSLQTFLTAQHYTVMVTSRWHDIFGKIAEFTPDLVILDVFLDGIDGRNICMQLKKEEATKNIPVMMFSGNEAVADHILSYGADDFIPKPFAPNEFMEKIRRLTDNPEFHN